MIVFMVPGASEAQLQGVSRFLDTNGLSGRMVPFDGTIVFVAVAIREGSCSANSPNVRGKAETLPGVAKVVHVPEPFFLASRKAKTERTVVRAGSLSVGDGTFSYIAGPCTVETEKQVLETAIAVKKAGATGLRGGAYKPRTSPYVFQGLKIEGLKILAKAREETGLAIVTEAMSPEELPIVAEYADIIQIGTRNAQNYRLLEAAGNIRKPVLLKRGFCSSLEEFLMSAEYVLAGGNQEVILCERGIRTFETYVRFTLPLAIIPELRLKTHLPVVVDPSHAAGKAELVGPLCAASTAAGADGLLIEVHPDPQTALCDGRQSLTFEEFEQAVRQCNNIAPLVRASK